MSMFYLHTKKSRPRYGDGGDEKGQMAARTGYVLRFASLCHGCWSWFCSASFELPGLVEGDVLTVTRLDQLARSPRDLLNSLASFTAPFACLALPLIRSLSIWFQETARTPVSSDPITKWRAGRYDSDAFMA